MSVFAAWTLLFLSGLNPVLSARATDFVGRPISVYCEPVSGYGAQWDGHIVLNKVFCRPLEALSADVWIATGRQGVGLISLTHEMLHARGLFGEARTECVAFQQVDDVARSWFVSSAYVPFVVRAAYANHRRLVRSDGLYRDRVRCRAGGAWDQSPGDGVWP